METHSSIHHKIRVFMECLKMMCVYLKTISVIPESWILEFQIVIRHLLHLPRDIPSWSLWNMYVVTCAYVQYVLLYIFCSLSHMYFKFVSNNMIDSRKIRHGRRYVFWIKDVQS
jgi:hypothetical protein